MTYGKLIDQRVGGQMTVYFVQKKKSNWSLKYTEYF